MQNLNDDANPLVSYCVNAACVSEAVRFNSEAIDHSGGKMGPLWEKVADSSNSRTSLRRAKLFVCPMFSRLQNALVHRTCCRWKDLILAKVKVPSDQYTLYLWATPDKSRHLRISCKSTHSHKRFLPGSIILAPV